MALELHQEIFGSPVKGESVQRIAKGVSAVGMEITDISADTAVIAGIVKHQVEVCSGLSQAIHSLNQQNRSISQTILDARDRAAASNEEIIQSRQAVAQSVEQIRVFAGEVQQIEQQLSGVAQTLKTLKSVTAGIDAITRQSHLLSLNASIECARAGSVGASFAVVANEMKSLAKQVEEANHQIGKSIEGLGVQIGALIQSCKSSTEQAVTVQKDSQNIRQIIERVGGSFEQIRTSSEEIHTGSQTISQEASAIETHITTLQQGIEQSSKAIEGAAKRVEVLIGNSEELLQLAADSGVEVEDSCFINWARDAAAKLTAVMEGWIERNELSEDALFDENYLPIAGSNPPQVRTRFLDKTDRDFPEIQEELKRQSPLIVFCAAIDRNGYIPTHNVDFSKPQGSDVAWNTANCRNRRIFADRVGLASGRNTKPFLIQLYRRDMGGGKSVLMKDLSIPLTIRGRHWGNLRMGYRLS